jgi:Cys-rich protein (TIGR01571 family)
MYMGCDAGPLPGMTVSWVGGKAVTTTIAAPMPIQSQSTTIAVATVAPSLSQAKEAKRLRIVATNISVYIIFVFLAAYINRQVASRLEKYPHSAGSHDADSFAFGLFRCFQDSHSVRLSFFAFCCPLVIWADTMDKSNYLDLKYHGSGKPLGFLWYWPAVLLTTILLAFQLYVGTAALYPFAGGCIFGSMLLLVAVHYRQRLRRRYDIPAGSCRTVTEDCLTWLCCPCCAVVQEARQVHETDDWPYP